MQTANGVRKNGGGERTITGKKKKAVVQKGICNACCRGAPNACDICLTESQLAKAELPDLVYTGHAG